MTLMDALEASYPYRVLAGALFFLTLGALDRYRHPENPRRAKEYLFLLFAMTAAVVYAIVHDQVTVTISPEYFLTGKDLLFDPRPLRWAVTVLAAHAAYGPGLLVGAALLIANNPSRKREQLPYRPLVRLALVPLGAAIAVAVLGGVAMSFDPLHERADLIAFVGKPAVSRFLIVQGVHMGSYAGGALGMIAAAIVIRRRRPLATEAGTSHAGAPELK
jgi:hypothetical protein